jgi:chemotaxis protein MotD
VAAAAAATGPSATVASPSLTDGSTKDPKDKDTGSDHATANDAAGRIAATPDLSAQNTQPAGAVATPATAAVNPQAVAAVASSPSAAAAAVGAAAGHGNDPLAITGDASGRTGGPQAPMGPNPAPVPTIPTGATGTPATADATGKAATPNAGGSPPRDANDILQTEPSAPAPAAVAPAVLPGLAADQSAAITNAAVTGLAPPAGDGPDTHSHDVAAPADPSGNAVLAVQTQTASGASAASEAAPAAGRNETAPVPLADVAVTIAAHAQSGNNRFEIRLDPPELGRIDVQLNVDSSGNVSSRLIVERPDTLNLLVRDAPQLQRALQDSGLNTGGGMQFSLADQGFANRNGFAQPHDVASPPPSLSAAGDIVPAAALQGYGAWSGRTGGLDITV